MGNNFKTKTEDYFKNPETQYKPDLRWWLAEGLNTDDTLRKNVAEIYDNGFGATEFLAMPEPGADSSVYGWGSQEWTADTRLIIEEATKKGLGFSFTSGSHWANANLPDTYCHKGEMYSPDSMSAAKELDYSTIILQPGETFNAQLPLCVDITLYNEHMVEGDAVANDTRSSTAAYKQHILQGVVSAKLLTARRESGQDYKYMQGTGSGVIDFSTLSDITELAVGSGQDFTLNYTAPSDGTYVLLVYWMHGTGQTASPSVSTNYTINYVDEYGVKALIDYWEEVVLTDSLKEIILKNGRGEIYMDSLELHTYGAGGLYWGYNFKKDFYAAKGYDITKFIPILTVDCVRIQSMAVKQFDYVPADELGKSIAQKVQRDFYDVLTSLYVQNVLKPLKTWLNSLGMTLRAEPSYGMPYEISVPAKYIDGIETESYAQVADLDLFRGMFGSANFYNRLFSSETGAVRNRNYYYNIEDYTQLCYLQFAGGVNRTVFHGYSAIEGSQQDTYWPGHEGMYALYSERFNSRQPYSVHFKEWTKMLARNQKVLRQGTAVRDIAILRTDYAFINYGQPQGYDTFECNYFMHDKPYFWQDLSLQQAGYTYDYFSPLLLCDSDNLSYNKDCLLPNGPSYKALIVYQESIELSSAKQLLQVAKEGLTIIFANNNFEIPAHDGNTVFHGKAASTTSFYSDDEQLLCDVINEIKKLPNVKEVDSPSEVLSSLKTFGIMPRVAFEKPNNKIITLSRLDRQSNTLYTFVYSYKFRLNQGDNPFDFKLKLEGTGIPYSLNDWTGEVTELALFEHINGCTEVPLTLIPGQSQIIVLQLNSTEAVHATTSNAAAVIRSDDRLLMVAKQPGNYKTTLSDGNVTETSVQLDEPIVLDCFDIEIEDWNEGEKVVNIEEKFGHVTEEVYFTTKKTLLYFKNAATVSWHDLPATSEQLSTLAGQSPNMSHVSGVGRYYTEFDVPKHYSFDAACLKIASAGGGSVKITVNGKTAPQMNLRTLETEVGDLLVEGKNTICIEVTSNLTNRMIQRGYKDKQSGWTDDFPTVQPYGISGKVVITPYKTVAL